MTKKNDTYDPKNCYPCWSKGLNIPLQKYAIFDGTAVAYKCPQCGHINRWNHTKDK